MDARQVIRVFPRRTSYTPRDSMAFVGDPPLIRPTADAVEVSVTFTWDRAEGERLAAAWGQHYPRVSLGGPAFDSQAGPFTPGHYVKDGVTFTTRGCNRRCPWCFVPGREGRLSTIPIAPGWIVQDNNLLQAPFPHLDRVFEMLAAQPHPAVFAGGLQPGLVTEDVADLMRGIRVDQVFLAADTQAAIGQLRRALRHLDFLGRRQLRCYVMIGYRGETLVQATRRLEDVWEAGAMPFAQLYQPPDHYVKYLPEWKALARTWSRPAAMVAAHKGAS